MLQIVEKPLPQAGNYCPVLLERLGLILPLLLLLHPRQWQQKQTWQLQLVPGLELECASYQGNPGKVNPTSAPAPWLILLLLLWILLLPLTGPSNYVGSSWE